MTTERILDPNEVSACAELAQTEMTGTREGSDRPTWKHAEEVAAGMEDVRGFLPAPELLFWQGVGWLHDVLEDCESLDAHKLVDELTRRGVDAKRAAAVVEMVEILTKRKGEVETYFQRIRQAGIWQLSYLKIVDRVLNLQEGKDVFTRKRWNRYVQETKEHVIPLFEDLPDGIGMRLFLILSLSMFRTKRRGPRQRRKKGSETSDG